MFRRITLFRLSICSNYCGRWSWCSCLSLQFLRCFDCFASCYRPQWLSSRSKESFGGRHGSRNLSEPSWPCIDRVLRSKFLWWGTPRFIGCVQQFYSGWGCGFSPWTCLSIRIGCREDRARSWELRSLSCLRSYSDGPRHDSVFLPEREVFLCRIRWLKFVGFCWTKDIVWVWLFLPV